MKTPKKQEKKKVYEFNGVSTYAHCFSFTIEAGSKKKAKEVAREIYPRFIDPAIAEFQEMIKDEPILIL